MKRILNSGLAAVVLAGGLAIAVVAEGTTAKRGMDEIVTAAKGSDPERWKEFLPDSLVSDRRSWTDDDRHAWREGFARELAAAKRVRVAEAGDEAGDEAVASWRAEEAEKAIRLRRAGESWVVDCRQSYLVGGAVLERARGSGSAEVTLVPRFDNSE